MPKKSSKRKKSEFCTKCGECCKNFVLKIGVSEELGKWLRRVYGTGFDSESVSLVIKEGVNMKITFKEPCQFLDKDNSCIIYKDRPKQCRKHFCAKSQERFMVWEEIHQGIL